MKRHFKELGIADKLIMFQNGTQVTDYFDFLLEDIDESPNEEQILPVILLLLDINMQPISGIDTLKLVKQKY